jgi:hypothetical protein
MPDDAPDAIDYTARLLFCCRRMDELQEAIAVVREIVLTKQLKGATA